MSAKINMVILNKLLFFSFLYVIFNKFDLLYLSVVNSKWSFVVKLQQIIVTEAVLCLILDESVVLWNDQISTHNIKAAIDKIIAYNTCTQFVQITTGPTAKIYNSGPKMNVESNLLYLYQSFHHNLSSSSL